jgi:hypothetical protein
MKNNRTYVTHYTLSEWLCSENWTSQRSMKIEEKINLYKNKEENQISVNRETAERFLFLL